VSDRTKDFIVLDTLGKPRRGRLLPPLPGWAMTTAQIAAPAGREP